MLLTACNATLNSIRSQQHLPNVSGQDDNKEEIIRSVQLKYLYSASTTNFLLVLYVFYQPQYDETIDQSTAKSDFVYRFN